MKTRSNLVGLVSMIMVLLLAYAVDLGLNGLREYGGRSFDFRTTIAGQLGLVLLFGLLLVAFQTVMVHLKPARWLFWACIALGIAVFIPFIGFYFAAIPAVSSLSSIAPPWPYTTIAGAVVFWTGVSHMFRRDLG